MVRIIRHFSNKISYDPFLESLETFDLLFNDMFGDRYHRDLE